MPEKYRINQRNEECQCGHCGCPLLVGDDAWETDNGAYCSRDCAEEIYRPDYQPDYWPDPRWESGR